MNRSRRTPRKSSLTNTDRLARGLGWFSLALGMTELIWPGKVARTFGLGNSKTLVRAYGLREIGAGMGALSTNPAPALWARVGGDVLDLATLCWGLGRRPANAGAAIAAVLGVTILDVVGAIAVSEQNSRGSGPVRLYRDRSGFPKGAEKARGIARDALQQHNVPVRKPANAPEAVA